MVVYPAVRRWVAPKAHRPPDGPGESADALWIESFTGQGPPNQSIGLPRRYRAADRPRGTVSQRHVEATVQSLYIDLKPHILLALDDVTDWKKAENALREAN